MNMFQGCSNVGKRVRFPDVRRQRIVHVTFEIHGDGDLVNTVREKVIPILHAEYENNSRSARTNARETLRID